MNSPQEDIAMIRKYHNGELNPAEKNQLEARALDDPFLQDALDGFEELGVKDNDMLILEKRLNERIAPARNEKQIWGAKHWRIAASILLCIALGSIYFSQIPKDKTIALNDLQRKNNILKAKKPKNPSLENITSSEINLLPKAKKPTEITSNATSINKGYRPEPDIVIEALSTVPAMKDLKNELGGGVVVNYGTQKKQELTGAVSNSSSETLIAARMSQTIKEDPIIRLKGKIIDEKDSSALPGVSIKNLETGVVKHANSNGEFIIEVNRNANLAFNYLGYQTKKTVVQQRDSVLISLTPDLASLNQIAVVGYGIKRIGSNSVIGPKVGWKQFKNYLEKQGETANIGRGEVQVQFIIKTNDELSDFKIIHTFSEKAGVAAINIIKNYNGGWDGSSESIPYKANITIKFK